MINAKRTDAAIMIKMAQQNKKHKPVFNLGLILDSKRMGREIEIKVEVGDDIAYVQRYKYDGRYCGLATVFFQPNISISPIPRPPHSRSEFGIHLLPGFGLTCHIW